MSDAYKYIKTEFILRIRALSLTHPKAKLWVDRKVRAMFAGRKGHGGGPCGKRVLGVDQLRALLSEAYLAGMADGKGEGGSLERGA